MTDKATDSPHPTPSENAVAAQLLIGVVAFLIIAAVLVMLFGLPVLGILGLIGTLVVFVIMLAFTAGN